MSHERKGFILSEIVEHADGGNGQPVRIGDSNLPVSMKVYQDIYHQITGRTEQIRKRYTDNILLEMTELEQLHHKILQLCDVHDVVVRNETISVFHDKDRKEQFTSFERFRRYNANSPSPCVNVVLKYNFSIVPAGRQRPQEYVVTVRLTSRVAILRQAEEEAPPFIRGRVIALIGDNTAEVTVDYADYVIARGFLEAFDEWIRGCKCVPKKDWLRRLQGWSHLIPQALQLGVALLIVWYALAAIPGYFASGSSPEAWARFVVLYMGASYMLLAVAQAAGRMIEEAIDTYPTLSYLKLNKGDERMISEFQRRARGASMTLVGGAVLTVILGIISAKLEKML